MTAIAHSENFHEWYKSLGGDLNKHNYTTTQEQANFRELKFSSLKIDPELTKKKHNYKFRQNEHY